MTWFGYFLIIWWLASVALTAGQVGKQRKPIEPDTAAVVVIINALLICGVLTVGTNP